MHTCTHAHIHTSTHAHIHIYIYIYIMPWSNHWFFPPFIRIYQPKMIGIPWWCDDHTPWLSNTSGGRAQVTEEAEQDLHEDSLGCAIVETWRMVINPLIYILIVRKPCIIEGGIAIPWKGYGLTMAHGAKSHGLIMWRPKKYGFQMCNPWAEVCWAPVRIGGYLYQAVLMVSSGVRRRWVRRGSSLITAILFVVFGPGIVWAS